MDAVPVLEVQTSTATYPVHIGPGVLAHLPQILAAHSPISNVVLITSPTIDDLWGNTVRALIHHPTRTLHIPAGEQHKRLSTVEALCEQLASLGADRDTLLIALGGGVLGDITGFLAAVYMRGLRFLQIPTTLLAQVDSSVGGKTGVNLAAGKNLVGSFHQPVAVLADTDTLSTLPARELRAGLQESLKSAVLGDPYLFDYMERHTRSILHGNPEHLAHVVEASVRVKARIVAEDEFETGLRATLNLGHTLGHAIEAATGYTELLHGEAIGWGTIAAVRLAQRRNSIAPQAAGRIVDLIHRTTVLPAFHATADDLVALTARDKKNRSGVLKFILPTSIGTVEIVRDVTPHELHAAATAMLADMQATALHPQPQVVSA